MPTSNRRILTIDDNEAIHNDFRKILASTQPEDHELAESYEALFGESRPAAPRQIYELTSALQGQEGVALARHAVNASQPFAMAFVDMRMPPGWDGVQTIEELWKVDPELQVVICTAYSDYTWAEIISRLDCLDRLLILKKPFDEPEIRQLAAALTEKWNLARRAASKLDELEVLVGERTSALTAANKRLEVEMAERLKAAEQLREKDEQLRQQQKLEAIGSLAGGVAHEFNNLLQVIAGYTRFVVDDLEPGHSALADLEQVLDATERAATISRQLLDFSRRGTLPKSPHAINDIVASTAEMLRPVLGPNYRLTIADDEQNGHVTCDPTVLSQVVMNLCINARDAMRDGGEIWIAIEQAELPRVATGQDPAAAGTVPPRQRLIDRLPPPELVPGRYLAVTVSDSGCGISDAVRERVFEPFFTTKEVGKGTGMGLAMVYGAVQDHGGAIVVASEPGEGTVFRIYLPRAGDPACQRVPSPSPPEPAPRGSATVLLAEDEPAIRSMAERALRQAGYRVLTATDGESAIRTFDQHRDDVSLAVLDVVMPRRSGHDVARHIAAASSNIGLLMCTGFDGDASAVEPVATARRLQKPYAPAALIGSVRQVLEAHATLPAST